MKKIFVSSTFRDMQFERDALQTIIMPEMRSIAQKYGEDLEVCDLRWGVNTGDLDSESGAQKVLSVCLDEIDKCRPFMLVILGERYGWIPDSELLEKAALRKKYTLSELEKSVTALEIEYGALNDSEVLQRSIFMFREPIPKADEEYQSEGEVYAKRLNALKEKIRKIASDRVFDYHLGWDEEKKMPTEIENFTQIVIRQMRILLETEWKGNANLHENQREEKRHWAVVDRKAGQFSGRYALLNKCKDKLENGKGILAITGDAGNGKSTLWCKIVSDYREQGWNVLPFVCGNTSHSIFGMDIIRQWVYYIESLLDIEHFESEKLNDKEGLEQKYWETQQAEMNWKKRLRDVLDLYCAKKNNPNLLLAADGLDQLDYDDAVKNFSFLPAYKEKKVHFLISFLKGYDMKRYGGDCIEVNCMEEQEKSDVLHGILAYQRKGLDSSVIDEVLKKKSSENPLYLSLLAQRLAMMDRDDFAVIARYGNDMQAIDRYQIELISHASEDLEGMCCLLVQETGERVNKELVQRMSEYIAVSRQGLRERDIRELLNVDGIGWDNLSFSRAIHYMPLIFSEKNNGQIDFTHGIVRESLRKNCPIQQLQLNIFTYLQNLLPDDELRLNEIVYYCYILDEGKYLIDYIQNNGEDARKRAARGMYQICIKDRGKWFVSIMKDYGKAAVTFLEYYLNREFEDGSDELQMQLEMNLAALEWCRNENLKSDIPESVNLYARVNYTVSKIYTNQGDYKNALVYCEKYSKLCESIIKKRAECREYIWDDDDSELFNSYYALAYLYERMGNYDQAIKEYNKCLELEQCITNINWEAYCLLLISAGRACEQADRVSEALFKLEKANEIIEANKSKLSEEPAYRELYVHSREYMGRAYEKAGDLDKALEQYHNLYSMNLSIFEEERTLLSKRNYGISCMRIGGIYEKKGNMDKALEFYLKDLECCYEIYKKQKTFTATRDYCVICDRVGMIYEKKDDVDKALEKYLESYNLRAELFYKQDDLLYKDDYQISCGSLGRMYFKKGEYMTALDYYLEEEKILKVLFDNRYMMNKHSEYSICWGNIAGVYGKLEQYVFSLDAYEKMVYAAEVFYKDNPTEERKKFYEQKMRRLQTILERYRLI